MLQTNPNRIFWIALTVSSALLIFILPSALQAALFSDTIRPYNLSTGHLKLTSSRLAESNYELLRAYCDEFGLRSEQVSEKGTAYRDMLVSNFSSALRNPEHLEELSPDYLQNLKTIEAFYEQVVAKAQDERCFNAVVALNTDLRNLWKRRAELVLRGASADFLKASSAGFLSGLALRPGLQAMLIRAEASGALLTSVKWVPAGFSLVGVGVAAYMEESVKNRMKEDPDPNSILTLGVKSRREDPFLNPNQGHLAVIGVQGALWTLLTQVAESPIPNASVRGSVGFTVGALLTGPMIAGAKFVNQQWNLEHLRKRLRDEVNNLYSGVSQNANPLSQDRFVENVSQIAEVANAYQDLSVQSVSEREQELRTRYWRHMQVLLIEQMNTEWLLRSDDAACYPDVLATIEKFKNEKEAAERLEESEDPVQFFLHQILPGEWVCSPYFEVRKRIHDFFEKIEPTRQQEPSFVYDHSLRRAERVLRTQPGIQRLLFLPTPYEYGEASDLRPELQEFRDRYRGDRPWMKGIRFENFPKGPNNVIVSAARDRLRRFGEALYNPRLNLSSEAKLWREVYIELARVNTWKALHEGVSVPGRKRKDAEFQRVASGKDYLHWLAIDRWALGFGNAPHDLKTTEKSSWNSQTANEFAQVVASAPDGWHRLKLSEIETNIDEDLSSSSFWPGNAEYDSTQIKLKEKRTQEAQASTRLQKWILRNPASHNGWEVLAAGLESVAGKRLIRGDVDGHAMNFVVQELGFWKQLIVDKFGTFANLKAKFPVLAERIQSRLGFLTLELRSQSDWIRMSRIAGGAK